MYTKSLAQMLADGMISAMVPDYEFPLLEQQMCLREFVHAAVETLKKNLAVRADTKHTLLIYVLQRLTRNQWITARDLFQEILSSLDCFSQSAQKKMLGYHMVWHGFFIGVKTDYDLESAHAYLKFLIAIRNIVAHKRNPDEERRVVPIDVLIVFCILSATSLIDFNPKSSLPPVFQAVLNAENKV